MKTLKVLMLVIALSVINISLKAQNENTIVTASEEAQNLDLIAVMDMFKDAKDLQEFEKFLNDPVKGINNIDLNHDRQADYIRVLETAEQNYRVIVLQAVVGQNDFQDVAVINVERQSNQKVRVVCQGNAVLYGDDYYVEPSDEIYVHINMWPIWTSMFAPRYVYYYSPYYWGYYPGYYSPYYVISYNDYYNHVYTHYYSNHYYHYHNHAYHPPHNIYHPQHSNHYTYKPNPNRPGYNGVNPRGGNNSNGVGGRGDANGGGRPGRGNVDNNRTDNSHYSRPAGGNTNSAENRSTYSRSNENRNGNGRTNQVQNDRSRESRDNRNQNAERNNHKPSSQSATSSSNRSQGQSGVSHNSPSRTQSSGSTRNNQSSQSRSNSNQSTSSGGQHRR